MKRASPSSPSTSTIRNRAPMARSLRWAPSMTFRPGKFHGTSWDFYGGDVNRDTQWTAGYIFRTQIRRYALLPAVRPLSRCRYELQKRHSYGLQADNRTLTRYSIYSDESSTSCPIDNQLRADFETGPFQHTVLTGLDYWHLSSDVEVGYGSAPDLDIFNPDNNQTIPAGVGSLTPLFSLKKQR